MSILTTAILATAVQTQAMMPNIIPQPSKIELKEGRFLLKSDSMIGSTGDTAVLGKSLQRDLSAATGYDLGVAPDKGRHSISLALDKKLSALGDEGYRLSVKKDRVEIRAFKPAGAFYAIQTLRQLFPPEIFRKARVEGVEWSIPCVEIEDQPRFSWRGAHLDVARHFMPKEFIFKFLDLMALHKLNTFHWHLTEDQGWRLEIKRYPKLTEVGAWRKDTMLTYSPATYTGKPHGGFYTQDDAREVVAYAAERHITVVPEIEMPGHAQAAIAAYPDLGNTNQPLEVMTKWGVSDNVFNVEESTFKFLKNVLDEVMEIFPSKFIHIGGDECPKTQWKNSPRAQAKMKELGLKDEHELQSWFIRQFDNYLVSNGRRLIGWSEILEGGIADNAALMVWLGTEGALSAARSKHDVVMAQTSHTYFDYYQSRDRAKEPHGIGGYLPLETVYGYEPIPKELEKEFHQHIQGCQFQLWTEYMHNPKHVEYMAFPRACALAEVAWTQPANKDYAGFMGRLATHLKRLNILDVNFRKLDGAETAIAEKATD
ncbi:MAG: beta-N-acetylhexosaminidase [Fimbriimonadaceae bacterium]|nr:beta-N-acetylhexosaminidase [Fimbriimonadaceae bacterium]